MKRLTILTFIAAFLLFGAALSAQSYDLSAGLRMGTDWGLTGQYRVAKKSTVEAIFQSSLQREEVLLTGLFEQHSPLISRRFNFYLGGGLHKGWSSATTDAGDVQDPFGITLIGGAEFTFARLNISWDFKPAINLVGGEKSVYTQTGISLRYVMMKRNHFEKQRKKRQRRKRRSESGGFNWKFWEKDKK